MTRLRRDTVTMGWVLYLALVGAGAPAAAQVETDARVWTLMSVRGRAGASSPWRWTVDLAAPYGVP